MLINSVLAVFLSTPEALIIKGHADAICQNDLGIDQVSFLCGLITETHTITCSLISNLTGCSQSKSNIKLIPHLKVEDLILRLPKPQPTQPLVSPEGTAQEGTPPLYLVLIVRVCI